MTRKDQVFIVNVVVTNPTWEMVVLSVISWPIGVAMELNTITKIHKFKGLQQGHHFISMAMKVHNTRGHEMDRFIKKSSSFP